MDQDARKDVSGTKQSLLHITLYNGYVSYSRQFHHHYYEMAMFNLFDFLAMTRAEARTGLLKGQLIFIIKYLASFKLYEVIF
jgi:hypothetical protein